MMTDTLHVAHADRGSTVSKTPSLSIQRQNGAPSLQSGMSRTPEPSIIDNLRLNEAMTVSSSSGSEQYDDEFEYDVLYECQRGSWTFGYSSKSLLQFDPSPWCDRNMKYTPMDIHTYALPNPMWQWVNKDWLADMTGDVDELGWEYAFRFHGSTWHGNYKHFRSFARRRKWIRLRRRRMIEDDKSYHSNDAVSIHTASIPENDESPQEIEEKENKFYERLQKCRLDRERLKIVADILQENDTQLGMIQAKLNDYMQLFDFEDSRRKFALLLLSKQTSNQDSSQSRTGKLSEGEEEALGSVGFYSNVKAISNQISDKHKGKEKQ
ncbi:hypothetical protein BC943DRAFT_204520 [Umbelopsis sp. AD052]|nr:hypothetical protein BC943DRAFT_204520 [Umbelopsis sp. AD052]